MYEFVDDNSMFKGITKNELFDNEKDFQVMSYYLKPYHNYQALKPGVLIQNPFIKVKQNTPSFNIYKHRSGKWKYNDFATNDFGDVYDLVKRLFGLSFFQAKAKIRDDFLKIFNSDNALIKPTNDEQIIIQKETLKNLKINSMETENKSYQIQPREFTNDDKNFWNMRFGISSEILIKYKVIPISWFKSNTKLIIPNTIAYVYDIGEGYKIYQPLNHKYKFMYIGKKAENFIFGYEQLPTTGDIIFITGGEKDVLTLATKNYSAITLNSETATLPKWLYDDLKERFRKIIILYDNDSTGLEKSNKLCEEFDIERLILPHMEHGKDVSDYVSLGNSVDALFEIHYPQIFKKRFSLNSFTFLAGVAKTLRPAKKIWGCYVLENSLIIFPAERGIGKTFLMMQLAIMVASEADSFCGEEIELHGNVLYINLELNQMLISKRLQQLKESSPLRGKYDVHCLTFNGNFQEFEKMINEQIEKLKPVLIIIDNLRAASSHIDNEKNKAIVGFVQDLRKIINKHNCAIILVHHTKKGTQNQFLHSDMQSGAGALTDLADGDFFLGRSSQNKFYRLLKRVKCRSCEEQDGVKLLSMNPDTLWFELIEEEVNESEHISFEGKRAEKNNDTAEMKRLHAEGKTLEEIAAIFKVNKSTVSRRLRQ